MLKFGKCAIGLIATVVASCLSASSALASTIGLDLVGSNSTLSTPGFGDTYTGTVTIKADLSTTLKVDNGSANSTFNTIVAGFYLINGDTVGTLSFTGGALAAGSISFDVTNGSSTDTITVNYAAKSGAITHTGNPTAGAVYTIGTTVTSVTLPANFGGLDLTAFGSFVSGTVSHFNLNLRTQQNHNSTGDDNADLSVALNGVAATPVPLPAAVMSGSACLAILGMVRFISRRHKA